MWFAIAIKNVPDTDPAWISRLSDFMTESAAHLTEDQVGAALRMADGWTPTPP